MTPNVYGLLGKHLVGVSSIHQGGFCEGVGEEVVSEQRGIAAVLRQSMRGSVE